MSRAKVPRRPDENWYRCYLELERHMFLWCLRAYGNLTDREARAGTG